MYSTWKNKLCCNHIPFTNLVEGSWFDSKSEDANNTKTWWFPFIKSYFATFEVIFADSGLHDIMKLIYEGKLAADSILNGNNYDKATRAHFLIDAAILQHMIPVSTFTDNELSLMKTILDCSKIHTGIGPKDIPMAERFRSKIKNVLAQLDNAGRSPSLWCLYHYMVDTIKISIRAERMGDFTFCLVLQIGYFMCLWQQGILIMPKQHASMFKWWKHIREDQLKKFQSNCF